MAITHKRKSRVWEYFDERMEEEGNERALKKCYHANYVMQNFLTKEAQVITYKQSTH